MGILFALYGRTGQQTSANASRARWRWRHLVLICEIVTEISWYLVISGMDAGAKAGSQRRLVLLVVVCLLFSPCAINHAIVHRTQGSVVSVPDGSSEGVEHMKILSELAAQGSKSQSSSSRKFFGGSTVLSAVVQLRG